MKTFRFSPSPTGHLHLGSTRTALISYVMSKQLNANFILRIEDTDLARSTLESEEEIKETIKWLGVTHDPSVIHQSSQEADGFYKTIGDKLVSAGVAYYCACTKHYLQAMKSAQIKAKASLGYDGTCRDDKHTSGALRLNMAKVREYLDVDNEYGGLRHVRFTDNVYGYRHTDIRDLNDIVLLRGSGEATYLLANTSDDLFSGVSNIVRGADILPQTSLQILLRRCISKAFDFPMEDPEYTHVPLVLGENKEKLSKRAPTTKSILELRDEGFLPDAIIQFSLAIGNNSISKDIAMSLQEVIESYDASKNAKNNVAFSMHQLKHINKLHIRRESMESLNLLMGTSFSEEIINICKLRANTLVALKEECKQAQELLSTFGQELKRLESSGYNPEECKKFREEFLGGESGVSLSLLKVS